MREEKARVYIFGPKDDPVHEITIPFKNGYHETKLFRLVRVMYPENWDKEDLVNESDPWLQDKRLTLTKATQQVYSQDHGLGVAELIYAVGYISDPEDLKPSDEISWICSNAMSMKWRGIIRLSSEEGYSRTIITDVNTGKGFSMYEAITGLIDDFTEAVDDQSHPLVTLNDEDIPCIQMFDLKTGKAAEVPLIEDWMSTDRARERINFVGIFDAEYDPMVDSNE